MNVMVPVLRIGPLRCGRYVERSDDLFKFLISRGGRAVKGCAAVVCLDGNLYSSGSRIPAVENNQRKSLEYVEWNACRLALPDGDLGVHRVQAFVTGGATEDAARSGVLINDG